MSEIINGHHYPNMTSRPMSNLTPEQQAIWDQAEREINARGSIFPTTAIDLRDALRKANERIEELRRDLDEWEVNLKGTKEHQKALERIAVLEESQQATVESNFNNWNCAEAAEKRIMQYENDEASVCPEDVGFVELIGVLRKRIAKLEAALEPLACSNPNCKDAGHIALKKLLGS